jgi:competence protein ComFC
MMHPAIAKARAMSAYDGWVARAVKSFKYDRQRDRAQHLAESMIPAFASLSPVDVIIPVPLHPSRHEWRGFNQAELLARHIGKVFDVPVELGLQRTKPTDTQTHSGRDERASNMEGAFAISPGWTLQPNAHYVLIDDVYTTGATVSACAEVLDSAGAKLISVAAVAFDIQRRELDLYKDLLSAASTK